MVGTPQLLVIFRLVGLIFAVAITITSVRAYRRTGERTFQYSMVGFACLGIGLFIESFLFRFVSLDLVTVHAIESFVFALGFAVLYLSMTRDFDE
jgi:hypothetical protein